MEKANRNLERKYGFVKSEKTVYEKPHNSRNLCWSFMISSSFVHHQEWSCAKQKLDKTDTE